MASLNKCLIIGNLGRDPEVSYTPSGKAVAKLAIATTDRWTDKNTGEKKERTEWHRVTFFGKQAETVGKYLSKGKQIYVEGRLQTSSYEKDGITRYSTDIIASSFQFLGTKSDQNQNNGQQNAFNQFNNQNQNSGFNQQPQQPQQNSGFQNNSAPQNNGGFQQNTGGGPSGFQSPPDDDIPFAPNVV